MSIREASPPGADGKRDRLMDRRAFISSVTPGSLVSTCAPLPIKRDATRCLQADHDPEDRRGNHDLVLLAPPLAAAAERY